LLNTIDNFNTTIDAKREFEMQKPWHSIKSNSQIDDRTLIQQISVGDRKAFSLFYDRYKTIVFSLAVTMAGSHETAEDITLDVFTQIWENADKYHPEKGSVRGWVASITRYRSIDTLRRRNVRLDLHHPSWSDIQPETLPSNENPDDTLESAEIRRKVSNSINRLPKDQQEVLAMAYYKGYTHRQIAEALNEPLGTIKTRIRLGLQKLRQMFKNEKIIE
jgi:RNA polymerase sigma-70 factor (ECF subfamily)